MPFDPNSVVSEEPIAQPSAFNPSTITSAESQTDYINKLADDSKIDPIDLATTDPYLAADVLRTRANKPITLGDALDGTAHAVGSFFTAIPGGVTSIAKGGYKAAKDIGTVVSAGIQSPNVDIGTPKETDPDEVKKARLEASGAIEQLSTELADQLIAAKRHGSTLLSMLKVPGTHTSAELSRDDLAQYLAQRAYLRETQAKIASGDIKGATEDLGMDAHLIPSPEEAKKVGFDPQAPAEIASFANPENALPIEAALRPGLIAPVAGAGVRGAGAAIKGAGYVLDNPITRRAAHWGSSYGMAHAVFSGNPELFFKYAAGYGVPTVGKAIKAGGEFISQAGRELMMSPAEAEMYAHLNALAGTGRGLVGTQLARAIQRAGIGAVVSSPFLLTSDNPEQAGATVGSMAGLAMVGGGLHDAGTRIDLARRRALGDSFFKTSDNGGKQVVNLSTQPFDYGVDPQLDATHNQTVSTLSPEDQGMVNQWRHAMQGVRDLYVIPGPEFDARFPGQNGRGVDTQINGRPVILLREDTPARIKQTLAHEVVHPTLDQLTPEDRAELDKTLLSKTDPSAFATTYYSRLTGQVTPVDFTTLPDVAPSGIPSKREVLNEMAADSLTNLTVGQITNKPGLRRALQGAIGRMGEKLGIPMTTSEVRGIIGVQPTFRSVAMLEGTLREMASGAAGFGPAYGQVPGTSGVRIISRTGPQGQAHRLDVHATASIDQLLQAKQVVDQNQKWPDVVKQGFQAQLDQEIARRQPKTATAPSPPPSSPSHPPTGSTVSPPPVSSGPQPPVTTAPIPAQDIADAVTGLTKLGFKKTDAQQKVAEAVSEASHANITVTSSDLLARALSGKFPQSKQPAVTPVAASPQKASTLTETAPRLNNYLWDKVVKGDLQTTGGEADPVLVAARDALHSGEIKTQEDFDNWLQNRKAAGTEEPTAISETSAPPATPGTGVEDAVSQPPIPAAADKGGREAERIGVTNQAEQHAQTNPETDLVTHRVDAFGKPSITGKRLDPNDPLHQRLIRNAGLTSAQVDIVNDLMSHAGQNVALKDYGSAPVSGEVTGETRPEHQKVSTAQARARGEAPTQTADKNFVPQTIVYNHGTGKNQPSILVRGFSSDKFLHNAANLWPWLQEHGYLGSADKPLFAGPNDPRLVELASAINRNHSNGWTGNGDHPVEGTPFTRVDVTPDFQPTKIPQNEFNIINALVGAEYPSAGKTPRQADIRVLSRLNVPEPNPIWEALGDKRKVLEATVENVKPELIGGVDTEAQPDRAIRTSGKIEGAPRQIFAAAGFMPRELDAMAKTTGAIKANEWDTEKRQQFGVVVNPHGLLWALRAGESHEQIIAWLKDKFPKQTFARGVITEHNQLYIDTDLADLKRGDLKGLEDTATEMGLRGVVTDESKMLDEPGRFLPREKQLYTADQLTATEEPDGWTVSIPGGESKFVSKVSAKTAEEAKNFILSNWLPFTKAKEVPPQQFMPSDEWPTVDAERISKSIDGRIVGSFRSRTRPAGDLDIRVEDYERENIQRALTGEGFEYLGRSIVTPREALNYSKPIGTGYQAVEHFTDKFGRKLDVWHDTSERGHSAFMPQEPPDHLRPVSDELGLRYEGPSLNDTAHAFTDQQTGSTIDVPRDVTPDQLRFEIARARKGFGGKKFMPTEDERQTMAEDHVDRYDRALRDIIDSYRAGGKTYKWPAVDDARLKRIWLDYGKSGVVRDAKGMQAITDRLLDNIARLRVSTELMGHDRADPKDILNDSFDEEFTDIDVTKIGDHLTDKHGNYMLSDYGLPQIEKLYEPLYFAKTPEEQLHVADKILNIVHQRSDLAAMFVKGGRKTLSEIANQGGYVAPEEPPRFMPSDHPDAIDGAAIQMPDDRIFTGAIHPEAVMKAKRYYEQHGESDQFNQWLEMRNWNDGYLTKGGNFLTRAAALEHAKKIGQVTQSGYAAGEITAHGGLLEPNPKHMESMAFDAARRFMPQDDLGFYSQLERTLEDKMPNKAGADQIRGIINKGGVKADEIKWSGIDDFLKANPNPTKEQVLQHLRERRPQPLARADTKEAVRDLFDSGATIKDIASLLQKSKATINQHLGELGLTQDGKWSHPDVVSEAIDRYKAGDSTNVIADDLGVTHTTISAWLKERDVEIRRKVRPPLSSNIIDEARRLYRDEELSTAQVARKLGIGATTVAEIVREHGESRSLPDAAAIAAQSRNTITQRGRQEAYQSSKTGKWEFAHSSLESVRMRQLDADESVQIWSKAKERIPYGDGAIYIPDFTIEYADGRRVVEEIKPIWQLSDPIVAAKIEAAKKYFDKKNIDYVVVTEKDIGVKNIRDFIRSPRESVMKGQPRFMPPGEPEPSLPVRSGLSTNVFGAGAAMQRRRLEIPSLK